MNAGPGPRFIRYADLEAGWFTGAGGRRIEIDNVSVSHLAFGKTVEVEGEWVRVDPADNSD